MDSVDVCIIGAGVIGLAVAREIALSPSFAGKTILVLEQEASIGMHCSSRNSEVIHAGIYYPSNSLKSQFCVRGKSLLYQFCERYQVDHQRIGKHIVAKEKQLPQLLALRGQAEANGVKDLVLLDSEEIQRREPSVSADIALFSPSTGIIDSHEYMNTLFAHGADAGVDVVFATRVTDIQKSAATNSQLLVSIVENGSSSEQEQPYQFAADQVINCAGLGATALAMTNTAVPSDNTPGLHPCKGDYYGYRGSSPFSTLIYPLPDANLRGLGIHSTLDMTGKLRFGPDAYYIDTEADGSHGVVQGLNYAPNETKADQFANAITSYFPEIDASRLYPDYSGIRPKLSGPGEAFADFFIQRHSEHPGLIELFGIESPGLTASLAIAEHVLQLCQGD